MDRGCFRSLSNYDAIAAAVAGVSFRCRNGIQRAAGSGAGRNRADSSVAEGTRPRGP